MNPSALTLLDLAILRNKTTFLLLETYQEYADLPTAHQEAVDELQLKFDKAIAAGVTPQGIADLKAVSQESAVKMAEFKAKIDNLKFRSHGYEHCQREITVVLGMWCVSQYILNYARDGNLETFERRMKRYFRPQDEEETPQVCTVQDVVQGFPWMRDFLKNIGLWKAEGDGTGQCEEL